MKEIKTERWSLEEANRRIGKSFDDRYWRFLIGRIVSYPEINLNSKKEIEAPSYIPLKEVICEVIADIESGKVNVESCQVCSDYFDINTENGIFGDSSELKRFICNACSLKVSAKEFYDNYLLLKG